MKVGFIGLGNMGAAMAARLAQRGYVLSVYDVRNEAVSDFTAQYGATGAGSAREAVRDADVVTFMRTAWGNKSGSVTAAQVAKIRAETNPASDRVEVLRMK